MTRSLLEYMAQMPMTTNGAVNGGPLSAAIPAGNEGKIKNKKAKSPRLFRLDDEGNNESENDQYQNYDYEMDPDDDNYPDYDTDMSDPTTRGGDNDSLLAQLFKQFIQDNKELLNVDTEVMSQMGDMADSEDDDNSDDGEDTDAVQDIEPEMSPEAPVSDDGMDITDDPADLAMSGDESNIDLYGKSPLNPEVPYQDDDHPQYGYENEEFDNDNMDVDAAGVDMDKREEYPEMNGDSEEQDSNRQGVIRVVKGAHLVYKRENNEGLFDELWFLNVGKQAGNNPQEVKKEILSGTDIHQNNITSDDGSQKYDIWTVGNGQLLRVHGLPN